MTTPNEIQQVIYEIKCELIEGFKGEDLERFSKRLDQLVLSGRALEVLNIKTKAGIKT